MARSIQELEKNIAYYQYTNHQIIEELIEADRLLRAVGFDNGLETVKEAALEIIEMQEYESHEEAL